MIDTSKRSFVTSVATATAIGVFLVAADPAWSQTYPSRPVRIIVAWPPGGNADITARMIAIKLAERLGQPFIVENKPGAGTVIGTDAVAKATPDGYTLLVNINTALSSYLPREYPISYDPHKDLAPLFGVSYTQLFLAVNSNHIPSTSVKELLEFSKDKKMAYGSYGTNTTPHLFAEVLNRHGKLGMVHIPYKGESPMLADLVGGQVQMGFVSYGASQGFVRDGKIRLLAVVGNKRSEYAPNVPTLTEAGVPGITLTGSIAFYAPSRTPPEIIRKLEQTGREIVMLPSIQERLRAQMNTPWPASALELNESLDDQDRQWQDLLRVTASK